MKALHLGKPLKADHFLSTPPQSWHGRECQGLSTPREHSSNAAFAHVQYSSMCRGSALSCSVMRPPFSYRATDASVRHRPLFFTAAKSLPPYSMS
eukprot:6491402-Amphidinium_carterae.2